MANDPDVKFSLLIPNAMEIPAQIVDEAKEEAQAAKMRAEETRAYVLPRFGRLRGLEIPVEITSIQNLPGHSCLIVNDLLLLSYVEAEQILRGIADGNDGDSDDRSRSLFSHLADRD